MPVKVRNPYFDILKGIACICVVFIHCQFPGDLGMIVTAVAKFAVPVFFMISGYYAITNGHFDCKRKVWHIIKMILWAETIIFLYELLKSLFMDGWRSYLSETFNLYNLAQSVLLNKPITYSHLWFLYALIYCYITLYFIDKWKMYKTAFFLTIIGQIGFLLLGEGLTIIGQSYYFTISFGQVLFEWVPYNMYVFRALPYFLLGYLFAKKYINMEYSKTMSYALIIMGIIISIIERYLIGWFQFYFGTIFIVIALFSIAKGYDGKSVFDNRVLNVFRHIGKNYSDFIYIVHVLLASMLSTFMKITGLIDYNNIFIEVFKYIRPILILLMSLSLAEIRNRIVVYARKTNE